MLGLEIVLMIVGGFFAAAAFCATIALLIWKFTEDNNE